MKRIVMVSNELAPYKVNGGLGVAIERLVNQFNDAGEPPTVIFPLNNLSRFVAIDDSHLRPFIMNDLNYGLSDYEIAGYFCEISRKAVLETAKLQNFENSIFIAHDNEMAMTIPLIKELNQRVKTIFWLHSLYDYPEKIFFEKQYQKIFSCQSLMASIIDISDLVITSSGIMRDAEVMIWPDRLRSIQSSLAEAKRNGRIITVESLGCLPRIANFKSNSRVVNGGKEYFLFPSRPSFFKGIGFFGELAKRYSNSYDFFAVGPISSEITRIYPEIREINWLSQEELFLFMKSAKAVILPGITEGYGLSAAESILLSADTIYHDIGGQGVLNYFSNAFPIGLSAEQRNNLYVFWGELLNCRKTPQKIWVQFKSHFTDLFDLWSKAISEPLFLDNDENNCKTLKKYETWGNIIIKEVKKRAW